ncbi:MAG TPA: MerR family transcriptional regulator [Thermomicrobiaceae bacterium]|nr:MerR family transcriptional regulator [Thermomicrobiaceae bacterium]
MFRIGDFSRLTQVTVKALRHYDSLGLLEPARIDTDTGYRYYTGAQLPRLHRILALKDLGFSLEQVGQLLDAELSPEQLRAMLLLKQDETREQISAEQDRLRRIEARLQQLAEGSVSTRYDVLLKSVAEQRVASIRGLLSERGVISELFRELFAYQMRHRVSGTTWTAIWHETEYHERRVDAEATMTIDGPLPVDGRVTERTLPAVETMACVVHQGSPADIGDGCEAVLVWIESNGYRLAGPERVVMLERGGLGGQDSVVELQLPVSRVAAIA